MGLISIEVEAQKLTGTGKSEEIIYTLIKFQVGRQEIQVTPGGEGDKPGLQTPLNPLEVLDFH